ncbi:hypothetical protein KC324_g55 [Hortaea werneckii]|nr:hypothetical protein KC324_g55 [Hortaea werneckii]
MVRISFIFQKQKFGKSKEHLCTEPLGATAPSNPFQFGHAQEIRFWYSANADSVLESLTPSRHRSSSLTTFSVIFSPSFLRPVSLPWKSCNSFLHILFWYKKIGTNSSQPPAVLYTPFCNCCSFCSPSIASAVMSNNSSAFTCKPVSSSISFAAPPAKVPLSSSIPAATSLKLSAPAATRGCTVRRTCFSLSFPSGTSSAVSSRRNRTSQHFGS